MGKKEPAGLAVAGLIIGIIGFLLYLIPLIIFLALGIIPFFFLPFT
ncbi:MAG: hypothetical protein U9O98_03340 [Asgard group archaeon]|nr:hypothetical protein [Asgard group archaeon]